MKNMIVTRTICTSEIRSLAVGLAVCLFTLASLTQAQELVSRPVGCMRIDLAPHEERLVSLPFVPLTDLLQIPRGISVLRWDPVTASYVSLNGNTLLALHETEEAAWASVAERRPAKGPVLNPAEGFWLCNDESTKNTVYLTGSVILADTRTITLLSSLNLLGYPFSSSMMFTNTALGRRFMSGSRSGDRISYSARHGLGPLPSHVAPAREGLVTYIEENPSQEGLMLPGRGYWYERGSEGSLMVKEPRPYENPFPAKGTLPNIAGIHPSAKGTTLVLYLPPDTVSYDIFAKDLSNDEPLTMESGWTLVGKSLAMVPNPPDQENDYSLRTTWTDDQDSMPSRLYLLARADIDLNANGIPDAREKYTRPSQVNPTKAQVSKMDKK